MGVKDRGPGRLLLTIIGLLGLAALACNAVNVGVSATLPPPPAARTRDAAPPTDVPPTATATVPLAERTPLPTFTPRVATRDPNATPTPTPDATASPTPTVTIGATATPTPTETAVSSGPLTLSYSLNWSLVRDEPGNALGTMTLFAGGGSGGYRYYHDDLLQSGPSFTFRWATCRNKPGSVRVDSADGQSVRINYFEAAPCP